MTATARGEDATDALDRRPRRPVGVGKAPEALGLHCDAVAGRRGGHVPPVLQGNGIDEVLVEMIDVFDDAIFQRGADAEIVEDGEVLHVLAQAHAAGMRAHGHPELGRHKQNGQHLIDPSESAAIDLTEVDGPGLHQLLENDAVLTLLAGGDRKSVV